MKRLLLVGAGHSHLEVLRRFDRRAARDADVVVVDPERLTPYSGMLPGFVAGHYRHDEIHVDAAALAARAGARFVGARVAALDLAARCAITDAGETIAFDIASLDIGSMPASPQSSAHERTIAVKPVRAFIASWNAMRAAVAAGDVRSIAVVGAGAGGVETLLAMRHALRAFPSLAWHLIGDSATIMPQFPLSVRERIGRALAHRGVVVHAGAAAITIAEGGIRLADGSLVAADRVVWTTGASAQRWPRDAGLATDDAGFVAIDETLCSRSHSFVFAAGDCATQIADPRPKSGVLAVRQGPPLSRNLRRALRGDAARPFVPRRTTLALISTGDRCAVASYGRLAIAGRWVWRWKDAIDRRFIARYRVTARGAP